MYEDIDIITWVKNDAWCLPRTLQRLEDVIPSNIINRKIAIDPIKSWYTRFFIPSYFSFIRGVSKKTSLLVERMNCVFL